MRLWSDRSLLTDQARPWTGGLLAGCAILVAVLGVLFAHQTEADRFDHAVDSPVITWFGGDQHLALWLAAPGTLIPAVALSAAIAIGCLLTGRLAGAVLAAVAVPVAVGLNEALLKPLVHRTYLGQVTYPSGHTATMFALATTVTVLLATPRAATAPSRSSACGGTTSPIPWRAPPSARERYAGSRSPWTGLPSGGGWGSLAAGFRSFGGPVHHVGPQ